VRDAQVLLHGQPEPVPARRSQRVVGQGRDVHEPAVADERSAYIGYGQGVEQAVDVAGREQGEYDPRRR